MSASRLHNILGQGDDDTWKKLCEHSHSFLFASIDIDNQTQVTSLHELVWHKRKPTRTASGVTGWVRCRQNSRAGDPLGGVHSFRVHVCRQWPCRAVYHPSKYGDVPPPARHGKIVALCADSENVLIESRWSSLLESIERGAVSDSTSVVAERVSDSTSVVAERAGAEQGVTSAVSEPTSAVSSTPKSFDAEAIRTRIMARADEISVAGAWIGVFEIMAFCGMNKQRVVVQLEEGTVDPIANLAPRLIDKTWNMQPFAGRMVACRMVCGVWQVACWRTCTHYVAAAPLQHELPLQGVGVVAQMARLGYATIMTEANGDCGIESLLLLANSRRGPMERTSLRRRLQEFMQAAACSPVWHDAYAAAGELPESRALDIRGGGATASGNEEEPQGRKADTGGGGAMTVAESTNPCNPPASAAGPIVMADSANPALRDAILWSVGLKKPTDGFLRRMAASLTVAEGEQLVQAHIRDCGAQVVHRKTNKKH